MPGIEYQCIDGKRVGRVFTHYILVSVASSGPSQYFNTSVRMTSLVPRLKSLGTRLKNDSIYSLSVNLLESRTIMAQLTLAPEGSDSLAKQRKHSG